MNDSFYIELRKAHAEINKILSGNHIDEVFTAMEAIEDSVDMIQIVSIVMEQSTFLDAFIKLGDYSEKSCIEGISCIFEIYISQAELGKVKTGEELDDNALMDLFMVKCLALADEPVMQLVRLLTLVACISLKNGEQLQERHNRLMALLPADIASDYENSDRLEKLQQMSAEGVILNLETLSHGNVLFPRNLVGYSYVKFVDEALQEMNDGEIRMLIALLQEQELTNVMGVISGKSRKKIMYSLKREDLLRMSQNIRLLTYSFEGEKEGIIREGETYNSIREEIIPAVLKAIEKIIVITGSKFKYTRIGDDKNE